MGFKKHLSSFLACMMIVGCIILTGAATVDNAVNLEDLACVQLDASTKSYWDSGPVSRAAGTVNTRISANSYITIDPSISLAENETVTFNCTYSPKTSSVDFGVIAPDGLFYGISGTNGSINQSLRVNQRGSYTLAIVNNSSYAVTVTGEVTY